MNKLDIIRNILTAARLPENWDSYGAKGLDKASIVNAIAFVVEELPEVPAPAVVPCRVGYLQFEWNLGDAWMEIEVFGSGFIGIYYGIHSEPDNCTGRVGKEHLSSAFAWLMQQASEGGNVSEYKTGEQMAEEDENLQSLIRSAQKTVRSDLNAAYTLGVIAAVRWSSERIAAGGTVQEKGGGELEKCPECKGWKRWARQPDGSASEITCATCNGTGKATE